MCREYHITPPEWRALPKDDRIAMLADSNIRARAMQKASKARTPQKRYNATTEGERFWTGG